MYLNFELLYKSGFSEGDYTTLLKIAQKKTQFLNLDEQENINRFMELELVQLTKVGKTIREKLRISPKGKKFLQNLEIADYSDEIQYLENKLVELYESNNKEIGLRVDLQKRLTWFISETGFRIDVVEKYVERYLQDTDPKYVKNLTNLIWTPQSLAFSVHFNLKDSKLFDIIVADMNLNPKVFLDKRDKETEYLFTYGTSAPPKGLDNELYYTGSYEGDVEHFLKLAEKLTEKIVK